MTFSLESAEFFFFLLGVKVHLSNFKIKYLICLGLIAIEKVRGRYYVPRDVKIDHLLT